MNILRRIGIVVCAGLLPLALVTLTWSHVAQNTVKDKEVVKGWLEESKFYDRAILGVLENSEGNVGDIPLNDPRVQQIVSEAFTSQFLRDSVTAVLDGTYGWLAGETAQPEFSIDIADAKNKLITNIGTYATEQAAQLPPCTQEQLAEFSNGFDAFSASCLPAGITAEQAGQQLQDELLASQDFLGDTTFSGADLLATKTENGSTVGESLENSGAPEVYQASNTLLLITGVIAGLLVLAIVLLSANRISGLRRSGVILTGTGILIGFSFLITQQIAATAQKGIQTTNEQSNAGKDLLVDLVGVVSRDVKGLLGWYTFAYLLIGVSFILLPLLLRKQARDAAGTQDDLPVSLPSKTESQDREKTETKKQPEQPPKIQL